MLKVRQINGETRRSYGSRRTSERLRSQGHDAALRPEVNGHKKNQIYKPDGFVKRTIVTTKGTKGYQEDELFTKSRVMF
jgi:hypothetical protein